MCGVVKLHALFAIACDEPCVTIVGMGLVCVQTLKMIGSCRIPVYIARTHTHSYIQDAHTSLYHTTVDYVTLCATSKCNGYSATVEPFLLQFTASEFPRVAISKMQRYPIDCGLLYLAGCSSSLVLMHRDERHVYPGHDDLGV